MKIHEILLIDDDSVTNFVQKKVIESEFENFSIEVFQNGLTAIDYIHKNPKKSYLIFLDINMPVMNGWEFLEAITNDKYFYNLKVFILTSSLDLSDMRMAEKHQLGSSFLVKPLKREVLKEIKLNYGVKNAI
ncbi:response regulator [Gelidibacter maritimus]|uniref:Response regulator n=1 Tax=Gelidibacter maritimus TaxID=2761487 RepID=A0A7W2R3T0_9FLAO|nr:response regulator [Gelidibacter maritimus]MBA6153119.1 response regulator [Gelidibacter maritimus]